MDVQCQTRLAPSLDGKATDETEAPSTRLEKPLELEGGGEKRFTSASAVKVSLELDQPRPGEPIDWKGQRRADGEQRIGGCQRVGYGKTREFLGAHPCQHGAGTPPLNHPFALECCAGGHEIYYHPTG
jgi:hypothetical protein